MKHGSFTKGHTSTCQMNNRDGQEQTGRDGRAPRQLLKTVDATSSDDRRARKERERERRQKRGQRERERDFEMKERG